MELKTIIFLIFYSTISFAQIDSTYIQEYPQKYSFRIFYQENYTTINEFRPNYPIGFGIGFSVKNTFINLKTGYNFISLKDKNKYGKTTSLDFKIIKYGRNFCIDAYYLQTKGFYSVVDNQTKIINQFPDLELHHVSTEGMYVFNSEKFSLKAAFEQSEKQIKANVGSVILSGGFYYNRLNNIHFSDNKDDIKNVQFGLKLGYGGSLYMGKARISGLLALGANTGNEYSYVKELKLRIYPAGSYRIALSYFHNDWSISIIGVGHREVVDVENIEFKITPNNAQLVFVKHFNHFF